MKILQIHNTYKYYGGEDTVVDQEASLLKSNGHKIIQIKRNNIDEIKSFFDKINTFYNLGYSKKSINILQQKIHNIKSIDIAHIHNLFPLWTFSILKYLKDKKIPIIITLHNYRLILNKLSFFESKKKYQNFGYFQNSKIKTFFTSRYFNKNKKLLDNVNFFIVFNNFMKKKFVEFGFPSKKIIIKPNFLIHKSFKSLKIEKKHNAVFASRVSHEKGILTLIKSWKKFDINLKLDIYGSGPLKDFIIKNTNDRINYHGQVQQEKIQEKIHNSKFLIFPSEWFECMPMTVIEAFQAKTLVLASKIGSLNSIIKNGYNGILFNPNDPADIVSKIDWVFKNPKKCNQITLNAYNEYLKFYSEKKNYKHLIGIYNKII